ncbi:MAG: hypothetical protein U9O94_00910 [Nanoarchaeota archaeon]|nr:hypothetical protein [Nanoarchaeota archaeon]
MNPELKNLRTKWLKRIIEEHPFYKCQQVEFIDSLIKDLEKMQNKNLGDYVMK